jgi:hypothetical protein
VPRSGADSKAAFAARPPAVTLEIVGMGPAVGGNDAESVMDLVEDDDQILRLHDLERQRTHGDARHPGHLSTASPSRRRP